jgi:hypothetical protein
VKLRKSELDSIRYYSNKQYYRIKEKERKESLRLQINVLKPGSCIDCGKTFEPECMEFNHIGPKVASISYLIGHRVSIEKILLEISKTELVCVLCHRDRTYSRSFKSITKSRTMNRIRRRRRMIEEHKSVPCAKCNLSYDHWKMDLDHVDPREKFKKISRLVSENYSVLQIQQELIKCQVLCALCHRRKTRGSRSKTT